MLVFDYKSIFSKQDTTKMIEEKIYPTKFYKIAFTKSKNLTNDVLKLVFITGGEATLELSGKKYQVTRGALSLIFPHEYGVISAKSATGLFLEIPYQNISADCRRLLFSLNNRVVKVGEDDIPRINDLYSAISYELDFDGKYKDDLITRYLYCLFVELLRRPVIKGDKVDTNIAKSILFINDNFLTDITLSDIALKAGVTENYFCALFKNKIGINCNRYIKELKIRYAEKLLVVDGLKAQDAAKKCGYASFSHFMSDFKSVTGKTPNAVKKDF